MTELVVPLVLAIGILLIGVSHLIHLWQHHRPKRPDDFGAVDD